MSSDVYRYFVAKLMEPNVPNANGDAYTEEAIRKVVKHMFALDEYQTRARETAIYPNQGELLGHIYCALKMAGEAGEVAEKYGKLLRDKNAEMTDEWKAEMAKEAGDVLWYVANLAQELGFRLSDIATMNLHKLNSRKERGVLQGSGDNR